MLLKITQFFFSAVLIGAILTKIPFDKTTSAFQEIRVDFFILAFFSGLLAWFVNTKKWQILLFSTNIKAPFRYLLQHNLLAILYNIVLPGQISAEVVKAYQISRNESQKTDIVTSIVADKVSGLFILFWIGILTLPVTMSHVPTLFTPILLLASIGIVLTLCSFSRRWYLFVSSLLLAIPLLRRFSKGLGRISSFVASYQQYGKRGAFIQTVGFALLFQIFAIVSFTFVAIAFGIHISLLEYFWVFVVVSLLLFLPISLAGLGVREGSMIFLLGTLGVSSEKALAASLTLFIVNIMMGSVGVLLHLFRTQPDRKISKNNVL